MIEKKILKPFHLLSDEEWKALNDAGTTWEQLNEEYAQPEWCDYPNALCPLGCWSLIYRMVKDEDYCKNCDCYKPLDI